MANIEVKSPVAVKRGGIQPPVIDTLLASARTEPPPLASLPKAAGPGDDGDGWLPSDPDRRAAFLAAYKGWHRMVRPEYAAAATPEFLFLFSALPVLVKCRDELKALDLWEPLGERAHAAKDMHPAWKKYCEFLPRAQTATQRIDNYRGYSLFTELDQLLLRVVKAEQRFREGIPKRGR